MGPFAVLQLVRTLKDKPVYGKRSKQAVCGACFVLLPQANGTGDSAVSDMAE